MSLPEHKYISSRPNLGDTIHYKGEPYGTVFHVDGRLCYVRKFDKPDEEALPFIWVFKDGLNNLHDWPDKHYEDEAPSYVARPWKIK